MRCGVDQELQISLMGDMYRVLSFLKLQAGISKLPLRCQKGCSGSSELRSRVLSMCKDLDGLTRCSLLVSEKTWFYFYCYFWMFNPHKYMVRRKMKWEVEGGGKRRENIHFFFLWSLNIGCYLNIRIWVEGLQESHVKPFPCSKEALHEWKQKHKYSVGT